MSEDGRYSLVEVQFTDAREDFDPAYANATVLILALARDEEDFKALVHERLDEDGLLLVEWGSIEPFDPAVNNWTEETTQSAHDRLSGDWPVQYGTFHQCHRDGLDS
ncbi:MAG TPA: hypothetical protein VMN38_06310 [Sphingomicrobium sp.]|nr:hypothetical protein [Sphingomicrobium sp.]